jgi:putative lipid kinase YegS-like protein
VTIKPGQAWGEAATVHADVEAASDREMSRALDAARANNEAFPTFRVTGGDLFRTLGGASGLAFPLDVGEVLLDGRLHFFTAHLLVQPQGWRRFVVAMNTPWMGEWNFGPKAHPNDGVLDVYEANLNLFEWRKVRSRLPTGAHLPHPRIQSHRTKAMTFEFRRGASVKVDGEDLGTAKHVAIRVLPDAITVLA